MLPAHSLTKSTSILAALHRNKEGLTIHQLGEATGLDHTTLYNELDRMLLSRQVKREPLSQGNLSRLHGKHGHYRYSFTEEFGQLVVNLG